jgi:polygalacturonase
MGHSSVTNCAIHNGYGWALHVKTSRNILIQGNTIWNFRPVGVGVQTSNNITIDGNVLGKVVGRTTFGGQKILDKEAGFSICAYHFPDPCQDIQVTNNIAGGIVYAGFLAPAHACGEEDTQTVFRNNTAHSSLSTGSGDGMMIFPNPADRSHPECYQGSHNNAYKINYAGVNSF